MQSYLFLETMDYYNTLGLKRGASPEEIKKAYRSMAMKHHPDRGGDEKKFKEISAAYDVLSDPQKKQMYDMGVDPNQQQSPGGFYQRGPFEFHFGAGMHPGMEDIFQNFGFSHGFANSRRNKSISINVEITLEDVLKGKDIEAEISLPTLEKKIINISIPPGIEQGQQIKYSGMGDHSIKNVRPGDLIVNVYIKDHDRFIREHNNLIFNTTISCWDAMLGSSMNLETLDKKTLNIKIPPGTQPETIFSCKGEGLPNMRNGARGNLLVKVKVSIPKNLNSKMLETINKIKNNEL